MILNYSFSLTNCFSSPLCWLLSLLSRLSFLNVLLLSRRFPLGFVQKLVDVSPLIIVYLTRPPVFSGVFSHVFSNTYNSTHRHVHTYMHALAVVLQSLLVWQCCQVYLDVSLYKLNKMAGHSIYLWFSLLLLEWLNCMCVYWLHLLWVHICLCRLPSIMETKVTKITTKSHNR